MKLPPFLLDQWLEQKFSADPPIEFDLGSSTGPAWTLRELIAAVGGGFDADDLLDTTLFYTPPAGSPALRSAIAEMEGVATDEVLVTTGAAEALLILFHLCAEPGANVVLPSPGFPANDAVAGSFGLQVRRYGVRAENGFRVDPEEVRGLIAESTKMLLVNSPHNPSGAVLGEAEMRELHDMCAERDVLFVSDQVYHPIYHGPETPSAARLPHATVIGDSSKALCLSGLRIGWMVEHDAQRRAQYLNARSFFTVSGAALADRVGVFAVKHREVIYERVRRTARQNLPLLEELLADFAEEVRWIRPQGGLTAFPWLAQGGNAREFCRAAASRGVLLAPGDCFGMPQHFRLGFAASGDRFPAAIERLREVLRGVTRRGRHSA